MLISKRTVEAYYLGTPKKIADKILFIKRSHRLDHYKQFLTNIEEFGNVWNGCTGKLKGEEITIIVTNIGPGMVGDCVYAVNKPGSIVLYSGTAGGLNDKLNIGNYLIAEEAVCGDGYSLYFRYKFLSTIRSDKKVAKAIEDSMKEMAIIYHKGKIFTTSSVVREADDDFWEFVDPSCDAIGMGTAAFYAAALASNKKPAAYFWITDFPLSDKSFFGDLSEKELAIKQKTYLEAVEANLKIISNVNH